MTDSSSNALIDALGLDELSPEQQEELLLELNEVIFRGSLVRLIERMDESAKADFATWHLVSLLLAFVTTCLAGAALAMASALPARGESGFPQQEPE